ncbi:MAG: DUF362 domain-containing protein [Ignisphaera sp.]
MVVRETIVSVAIVKNNNSYRGAISALNLIANEIDTALNNRKKILVKPNFVSIFNPLSTTPRETVEAIIDFIYNRYNISEIVIAESPAIGSFNQAIELLGYKELAKRYPSIEFLDLDEYEQEIIMLEDEYHTLFEVSVSKILMDNQFFKISACRAKTHDTVIVTLSIKNVVMGAIKRGYKSRMHRGYFSINYNIAKLATRLMPDLGVIDGVVAMEGDGPVNGEEKYWGVVFASTNPVNLDIVTAYAMGFNPSDIGYLLLLSRWGYGEIDIKRIKILGEDVDAIRSPFKPHRLYREQLKWKTHRDLKL